jgi:hypothetical protein
MKIEIVQGEPTPVSEFFSSPTPETDAAWDKYINHPYTYGVGELRILAQRLERERDKAKKLAQQMSESNQVLMADVRHYRQLAETPLPDNELHLKLALDEVAQMARKLKEERDQLAESYDNLRGAAIAFMNKVTSRISLGMLQNIEREYSHLMKVIYGRK